MRRRRRGNCCDRIVPVCVAFGTAIICLTFFSVEILLVIIALVLIALGLWMLFCAR